MAETKYVCVPVEPTREMRGEFHRANEEHEEGGTGLSPDHQWSAMLAAAPQSHVAVPRELLERAISFVETAAVHAPALRDAPHIAELRSLLAKE